MADGSSRIVLLIVLLLAARGVGGLHDTQTSGDGPIADKLGPRWRPVLRVIIVLLLLAMLAAIMYGPAVVRWAWRRLRAGFGAGEPGPAAADAASTPSSCAASTSSMPTCPICLDELTSGEDDVTSLWCAHTYHTGCISRAMETRDTCPVCRQPRP